MVILEQVSQMKGQGVPTAQIIQNLKEQGISPKEINEAISQSEIKTEVSGGQDTGTPQLGMPGENAATGLPTQGTDPSQNAATGAIPTRDPSMPQVGQNPQGMPESNPNVMGGQVQPGTPGTPPTDPSINAFPTGELGGASAQPGMQQPNQPGMQDPNVGMQQPNQPGMQDPNVGMQQPNQPGMQDPSMGMGPIDAGTPSQGTDPYSQQPMGTTGGGMQPSIGLDQPVQGQEQSQDMQSTMMEGGYPEYSPDQSYSDYGEQYPAYESPQATDIETINDISSQVAEEKIKQLKKDASILVKFRKESEERIKEFEKRLEKMENIIQELQLALVKKINNYGEDVNTLSKEMQNTRQTVSKLIDPLTDNIREMQKMTRKEPSELKKEKKESKENEERKESEPKKKSSPKKSSTSFEDYLR
jgi:hypothetical protein